MIDIRFADDGGAPRALPAMVRTHGLSHRFAVIQDTYDPDGTDMVFDAPLWLRLAEFAQGLGEVTVGAQPAPTLLRRLAPGLLPAPAVTEQPLAEFLSGWRHLADEDRSPPQMLIARAHGVPSLCIATEFWCEVGGPAPYHDSYTYVLCSRDDLGDRVRTFIAASADAGRWRLAPA